MLRFQLRVCFSIKTNTAGKRRMQLIIRLILTWNRIALYTLTRIVHAVFRCERKRSCPFAKFIFLLETKKTLNQRVF